VTKRYLVDANVVLRFLVQDHPVHSKAALRLFTRAENGEVELVIASWTVAEIVYTLSSVYKRSRADVAKLLKAIVTAVGVQCQQQDVVLDAFERFVSKNVDFADALLASEAAALKLEIASFDRDLDKFPDIKRFEP
jgi:predicted nucleic acid-binding protein